MIFRQRNFFLSFAIIFAFSCERRSDPTNQFITDLLKQSSVQVYKSEIQRTRVNFIPSAKIVVYSFWKKEEFAKNGTMFLHLYPKDTSLLPERRKEHGFINVSIKKGDFVEMDAVNFYMVKDLSSFGELDYFITGQYIGNKRTWFAKYNLSSGLRENPIQSTLSKDLDSVKNKLKSGANDLNYAGKSDHKITFINYLLLADAVLIFKEKSDLSLYLNKDSSKAYVSFRINADVLKLKYSLDFSEGIDEKNAFLERKLIDEPSINFLSGNMHVLGLQIEVPVQAQSMALFRQESGKRILLFKTELD